MTISTSGTNYLSNETLMAWMETKTDDLYGKMREAMGESNSRVKAEDALNSMKAKIDELKASGADAGPLKQELDETIKQYEAEFPEVREALEPISNELGKRMEAAALKPVQTNAPPPNPTGRAYQAAAPTKSTANQTNPNSNQNETVAKKAGDPPLKAELPHVKIEKDDAERWAKAIADKVDVLGKQDSLGMIHLQDLNAQVNRAKDMASALMASADKAADNIVGHIS